MPTIGRNPGDLLALEQLEYGLLRERQGIDHAADDHLLERRPLHDGRQLWMQAAHVEGDDDASFGILELAEDLRLGIEGIDVDDGAANLQHRIVEDDKVRTVGQKQPDLHALADTKLLEALGGAVDEAADLAIAVLFAEEVDTSIVRKPSDGVVENRV
jgi:hypothetical protein